MRRPFLERELPDVSRIFLPKSLFSPKLRFYEASRLVVIIVVELTVDRSNRNQRREGQPLTQRDAGSATVLKHLPSSTRQLHSIESRSRD